MVVRYLVRSTRPSVTSHDDDLDADAARRLSPIRPPRNSSTFSFTAAVAHFPERSLGSTREIEGHAERGWLRRRLFWWPER